MAGLIQRVTGAWRALAGADFAPVSGKAEMAAVTKADTMSAYQGVPAYWFARAIEVGGQETLGEPYRNSVWVQRAIKKVAGPVSAVPVVFLPGDHDEPGVPRTRKALRRVVTRRASRMVAGDDILSLPEIESWMEEPAPGLGWADFIEATIGWLKLKGEAFWVLSDEMLIPFPEVRRGKLPTLIVARPDRMRHLVENGQLIGWIYTDAGGTAYTLLPDQVITTKYWNPYDAWRGLSEYDSAQVASEGDWLAGKFSRNLMANNGDTGPFIVAKNGVPSDPQREQIIQDLKAKRQAQLRGDFRPIFMTGDVSVEDPQIRTVDANYIAQRLESRHEIAAAFGVPMSMFDVRNDYSMGSQSAYYQLILDTCIPTGAKICESLERLIGRIRRENIEVGLHWDDHPVMQTVRRERLATLDGLANRGMPVADISEYLNLGLPRFAGDDVGCLPMGVTPVDQVLSAPEPAADPALGEAPEPAEEDGEEAGEETAAGKLLATLRSVQKGGTTRNAALWAQHMRQRAATVKALETKARKVLYSYRAKVLSRLATHGPSKALHCSADVVAKGLVDVLFDGAQFGKELAIHLSPLIEGSLQTASHQLLTQELDHKDPWQYPPQAALDYVKSRTLPIQGTGETVRQQLNTALSAGIEAGESQAELEDRVRGVFGNLEKFELKRIATTETGMAFNHARHETMTRFGVQYKKWLSSHGPHVRPTHRAAEARYANEPIPIDEPFEVGSDSLMYPGDPSGSAAEVINCQCIQLAVKPPKATR